MSINKGCNFANSHSSLLTVATYKCIEKAGNQPAIEDGGQRQEATVSNITRSCVAAVNDPIQQSLSILIEY